MTTSPTFTRWQTVTATVKSNTGSGADFDTATASGVSFDVVPLMPAGIEIAMLYGINSPRKAFTTFTQGAPVVDEKDILTIGGADYRIRGVGVWPTDNNFYEFILEKVDGA